MCDATMYDSEMQWLADSLLFLESRSSFAGKDVIVACKWLLTAIEFEDFVAPAILPLIGGGLVFSWRKLDRGLDVFIERPNYIGYVKHYGMVPENGRANQYAEGNTKGPVFDKMRLLADWFRSEELEDFYEDDHRG